MSHSPGAQAPFWRRFIAALSITSAAWTVGSAILVTLAIAPVFHPPLQVLLGRTLFIAFVLLLAYTAAGQWRSTRVPRWVAQVIAVLVAAPLATLLVYAFSTDGDFRELFGNRARVTGLVMIAASAILLGLVTGLGAMVREREAQAKTQALRFALERETLERQAADARLALLQQQVEPHFLFNTLANVQTLVESGSPRAAPVLAHLIAYLRAALPQLHEGAPTLAREEALVRAYLELMLMRIPDRLHYTIEIDPGLRPLRLPAMTLLTLVENAVRHGIDPSERGGGIEVGARRDADSGRIRLWVADTGRGLDEAHVPGTGLANLRERLAAAYSGRASLTLSALEPHGVRAEIEIPADA